MVLSVGCGIGAASPTPTVPVPTTSAASGSVASPQRPALASPVASPSAATGASTTSGPTPTSAPAAGSDSGSGSDYEVQSGDTLLTISEQEYGDATQWRKIYDANKDTIGADPDKLKIGMKLKIPPKQ
jgi:nucleoid-associated protein YgaU